MRSFHLNQNQKLKSEIVCAIFSGLSGETHSLFQEGDTTVVFFKCNFCFNAVSTESKIKGGRNSKEKFDILVNYTIND